MSTLRLQSGIPLPANFSHCGAAGSQHCNTGTAAGKAFLDMLGVFAEFETNLRKERQAEGIATAKARGVYKGRKLKIDSAFIHKLGTRRSVVRQILRDGQGKRL